MIIWPIFSFKLRVFRIESTGDAKVVVIEHKINTSLDRLFKELLHGKRVDTNNDIKKPTQN